MSPRGVARRLLSEGLSGAEVARRTGLSEAEVCFVKKGLDPAFTGTVRQIMTWKSNGYPIVEIAARVGKSVSWVRGVLRRS